MGHGRTKQGTGLGIIGWAIVLVVWGAPANAQSGSEPSPSIEYRVKSGDTLIGLAAKYFRGRGDWREVQKLNRIAKPTRLQLNQRIFIPTRLLRSQPVILRVDNFTGPVRIENDGRGGQATKGQRVPEGALISTGREGFVSLAAAGGDTVSLPSQTSVRVLRARRYLINDRLDVLFSMLKGRATFSPTPKRDGDNWRVRTPVAVTAVRGTTFRIFHDETDTRSGTEVVEGTVQLAGDDAARPLEAGLGNIATPAGLLPPEKLLPPPALVEPGRVQTDADVDFIIEPLPGAKGYRVAIARDAGFLDVVAQEVTDGPVASFTDIPGGTFFVQARAIADSGLEGLSEVFSFRRQRVAASVEESPLAGGFKFAWRQMGADDGVDGNGSASAGPLYDFRLWKEGSPDRPLVAELGMSQRELVLTDLPPGVYFWQIIAVQPGPGGLEMSPGAAQKLTVSP